MKFEQSTPPAQETPKGEPKRPPERENPGFMSRLGRKFRTGLTALSLLTASEMAMEGVAFADKGKKDAAGEKAKDTPKDRWADEMDITAEREMKTEDGRTIYYFEGEAPPMPDGRKIHEIGMTIIDEGDPKVKGDEKRYDIAIVTEEANEDYPKKISFKKKTDAQEIKDGKSLQSPFGKVDYAEKDGFMNPATDKDAAIARIDKHYWAVYGLKEAGQLDTPEGKKAVKELLAWVETGLTEHAIDEATARPIIKALFEKK
jgi:hypothetical protein